MTDLSVELGPLRLESPLIAASGTVGSVVEFADTVDFSVYGAAVAKSVAPEPWAGRPAPRIGAAEAGMLNGIGIQNPGIDVWIAETPEKFGDMPTQVWGSVVAHDVEGFGVVASAMDAVDVAAIEVNLSCPNLDGEPFALDPELSSRVVSTVRAATAKPIGAKLSPDARPVAAVAEAVAEAGADWVVMGNTVMGAAIDPITRRPVLSGVVGGYSGGPIRPIAVRCVLEIRRDVPGLPIVGCGGVSRAEHVIEYFLAGASAVGIGSAHFATPRVGAAIVKDLRRQLAREEIDRITDLIGAYEPWA